MTRPTLLPAGREPLRHGYTIDDARRYALMAANSRYAPRTLPHHDRVDIAWYRIVEHLYETDRYPSPTHLCHLAAVAISRASANEDHHAGRDQHTRQVMPKFAKFWTNPHSAGHEDAVVERVALPQVLALLSAAQRDALVALAVLGCRDKAAAGLGLSPSGLDCRLGRARRTFYAAWFEGQTPPRRRMDRRVGVHNAPTSTGGTP
jgi:hypothetical protein